MTVRNFRGFPSLQEVECSGKTLTREVDTLSIMLFRMSDKSPITTVRTSKNTCHTLTDYASCHIDTGDPRKSVARVLVSDLRVGQITVIGCSVTVMYYFGHPQVYNWSIKVTPKCKLITDASFLFVVKVQIDV